MQRIRIGLHLVLLPLIVIFCVVTILSPVARAAVIDTPAYLNSLEGEEQDRLAILHARAVVQDKLIAFGVDADLASERLAALSDQEIRELQRHIDNLPAGGSVLATLGVIFIILIVLELVGVTNIFRTR